MITLSPVNNAINKFLTSKTIKDRAKQNMASAITNELTLKNILYKNITINELFN